MIGAEGFPRARLKSRDLQLAGSKRKLTQTTLLMVVSCFYVRLSLRGNDVFELAAEYAEDDGKPLTPDAGAWWQRRESTPSWPRQRAKSDRKTIFF